MESVKGALGRWGRRVAEAAKKTESLAGNTWQHREFFPYLFHIVDCFEIGINIYIGAKPFVSS